MDELFREGLSFQIFLCLWRSRYFQQPRAKWWRFSPMMLKDSLQQ